MRLGALFCASTIPAFSFAQNWQMAPVPESFDGSQNPVLRGVADFTTFRVDEATIVASLSYAPEAISGVYEPEGSVIAIPQRDGSVRHYRIMHWDMLSPEVQAQVQEQRVYRGVGVDRPDEEIVLDYSRRGLKVMIRGSEGTTFVEPMSKKATGEYFVYTRRDSVRVGGWSCMTKPNKEAFEEIVVAPFAPEDPMPSTRVIQTLYRYDLAINTTGEYTVFHGGPTGAGQAVVTSVARVNGVYRKDVGIEMLLGYVNNWPNGATDPFSNTNGGALLSENHNNLTSTIGSAAFDIGHIFSTGGGGIASLGSVGINTVKGQGVTGSPSPVGDSFDIDYVAHEMGHQFGGNHTFNGTTSSCGGGNRAGSRSYEPGSGSTIMSYAGICGSENSQSNSDAYFHGGSISEILALRNGNNRGETITNTTNNFPVVTSSGNFSIPQSTPFRLTATATDSDGNALTYCWEQLNAGGNPSTTHGGPTTTSSNNTLRALFRSFNPTTSGTRFFPSPSLILANNYINQFEFLPNVDRTMAFRCTVRDNATTSGGTASDNRTLTVSGAALTVTSPNTNVSWVGGSTQTITWTPGGSAALSPNVNIRLSTDGGNSYFAGTSTLLLANTPNDGTQTVTLPGVVSSTARIFVEASTGNFFDVSNVNFAITGAVNVAPTITAISPVTIDEDALYQFQVVASDANPGQTLTYSLTGTVPSGASINSTTGLFSWTPNESQGPGNYTLTVRVADNGSPSLNSTSNFSITVREVPKLIRGTVTFQALAVSPNGRAISATLLFPGGSTISSIMNGTTNGSGFFSLDTSSPRSTYDILIKSPTYLSRRFTSRVVTGTGFDLGAFTMIAGDVDLDNEIGPGDFEAVVAAFGNPGPTADADSDGEVGPSDFEIIVMNFGEQGE